MVTSAPHEIETDLSKLMCGRKVDLVAQHSLQHRLREQILATAQVEFPDNKRELQP